MIYSLRFGADAAIDFELGDAAAAHRFGTPRAAALPDAAAAVRETLAAPLELPPLSRCTTPSDRIVIALGPHLPQATELAAAVVHGLIAAGVAADGISLLRSQTDAAAGRGDPRPLLDRPLAESMEVITHDPTDRSALAYLAADERGEAILLHRALHDADFVLPIACAERPDTSGDWGVAGSVFPEYSDQSTIHRFRSALARRNGAWTHEALAADASQAAWLLGVTFAVAAVPGPAGSLLHVLAGARDAVDRRARELYRAAWHDTAEQSSELVVAAIAGGPAEQTWDNLGRAIDSALPLMREGGSLAICCELSEKPGPAVRWLARAPSRRAALRRIARELPGDTLPAARWAQAQRRGTLYLVSRLPDALVAQLAAVPLKAEALADLAERSDSCALVSNACQSNVTLSEG